ncbi:restriction endonuclease [Planosporangium thailandense]|uniref:restriction endonuclease n=1 Tax=Planosporangium thailandense TaxID=765197 RepID=UPI003B82ED97
MWAGAPVHAENHQAGDEGDRHDAGCGHERQRYQGRSAGGFGRSRSTSASTAWEEKKVGHGILVTTSWFTAGGWQKARDHGRIELVDGQRWVHLIKEHLGKDVLIGMKRPRNASTGPARNPTAKQ